MSQQELASLVLPYMEKEGSRLLNMEHWVSEAIAAEDDPFACGTTLCAAGWTAHVLGYHITRGGTATRGSKKGVVDVIAREALELDENQADYLFMVATKERAVECFREMADGNGFPDHMVTHWRKRAA